MEHHATEVPARPRPLLDEIAITLPESSSEGDGVTAALDGEPFQATEWPRLTDAPELPESDDPVDFNLEIEDGETTLFEAAINAFQAGEFQRAESLFLEEAQRNLGEAPQRAAISYRQAALAAGQMGNTDAADHWMRLAGREYLRVTEDDRTPLPFIREAAVMAAKCFISVENLHIASKGLRRAQAIESVIRADDDLMAQADADPTPPGPAPAGSAGAGERPAGQYKMIERSPAERPAPRVTGPSEATVPSTDVGADDQPASGWFQRLRHRRPDRHPA